MKKPVTVKSFSELSYLMKSGHAPMVREPWKGNWMLTYGQAILSHDVPYAVAVKQQGLYQRMGNQFPDKTKFSIKPYKGT